MHLRVLTAAAGLSFVLGITASGQQPLDTRLTLDPGIHYGVLPNGMHYYVRKNAYPAKRAELRLAVNAGSLVEDNDQRGMAHVIEHMGFNGTTHFKKNELVSYLQSIGVRFGADLNAYTSFDETVYMLKVPTDTVRLLDKGITVLADWAHGQLFDSTEVANERGVVVEEWRLGKGANDRMRQEYWPVLFQGSRYADRWVIGSKESILSSNPALLRRFYRDWYRPDLMAVVAVGDFDADQMVSKIKKEFSDIPVAKKPRPRPAFDVPPNKEPLVAIVTDKEATLTSVDLLFKLPHEDVRTVGDVRQLLMSRLFSAMLSARFSEMSQKPDAPFAQAFGGKTGFVRGLDVFDLSALAKDGQIERAALALITEAHRVDDFGFLPSELDRAKQNLLRGYERMYAERDKRESASLADEYTRHFLSNEHVPGVDVEYQLAEQLVPTISVKELNALASKWISDENRVVLVQAPLKPDVKVPTKAELLALVDRGWKTPVTAYTENVSTEALVATLPAPGAIATSRELPGTGITEWKLSNGARVLIKTTDFKADEVRFGSFSPGGSSLVSDADYMSATMSGQVMMSSGVGNFSRVDLTKKLSGKTATIFPSVGGVSEGLSGQSSPKDLETLLQLVYLQFTAPRLDTSAVTAFKNQFGAMLANRASSPDAAFMDTIGVTMSAGHPRGRPISMSTLAEINPQRAYDIFRDRFADASDFTFVFVGNVDTTALKPLALQYLASLPSLHRAETWKDVGMRPPTGVIDKVVRRGTEPKATTFVAFTGPIDYTEQNRFDLMALTELVRIKLIEVMREKMGGTYSPQINSNSSRIPRSQYSITAFFGSSPDNAEALSRALFAVVDSIKRVPPSQVDVDKVKEQLLRSHETELRQNAYWLQTIMSRTQNDEDVALALGPYESMIKALTPAQMQRAAGQYFDVKNYVRVVLLPEGPKPVP